MTTHTELSSRGFSDVDASGQVADHAAYLDRQARNVAEDREDWLRQLDLSTGSAVLDAGSGMGEVVRRLAELVGPHGRAVGVDLSEAFVQEARRRAEGVANIEFRLGDLCALPFDDNSFDAVYSERVFIHLDQPHTAMKELFRVLRPGGRLIIVDPDHTRAATDADDCELADLLASRATRAAANMRSGRHLRSQAVLAGFENVTADPFARAVTDRSIARGMAIRQVEERVAELVHEGLVTRERGAAYRDDQNRREVEGRFQVTMLWYLLRASKPQQLTESQTSPSSR